MSRYPRTVFDVALCAALISGIDSLETFAAAIIFVMVVVLGLGPFLMNAEMAGKLTGGGAPKIGLRFTVLAMYTAALLISGHPYLAAAYLITSSCTLLAAHQYRAKTTGAS